MYESFYHLDKKPFQLVPNPEFLYLTSKHRDALGTLEYGIMERVGFVLLTGDVGTGKTTLIRHLLNSVDPDIKIGLILNTNVTPGVANYSYPNTQPSATIWYHDHGLGITRNNVYAGPAGFWLIRESGGGETGLVSGNLPGPAPRPGEGLAKTNLPGTPVNPGREEYREIPIVIQDRSFNDDGSLKDNLYPYANAMKKIAKEEKVALVDLHSSSGELFKKLGDAGSAELANKEGDRTHFNEKGAKAMARLVMDELIDVESTLTSYIKD